MPQLLDVVTKNRRTILWGLGIVGVLFCGNWLLAPSSEVLAAAGRDLFVHEWTVDDPLCSDGDGLGPVFNDKSCVACHFQGGVGGGGGIQQNVTALEIRPNRDQTQPVNNVIHASAVNPSLLESVSATLAKYTFEEQFSYESCGSVSIRTRVVNAAMTESINSPALYGVGLIDSISATSIKSNAVKRKLSHIGDEFNLNFTRTKPGKVRKHSWGSVGRFGWKGQHATLEGFVATACAVEIGLTNSHRAQDAPGQHAADENAKLDMTNRQLNELVEFCRQLPRPEQILPTDPVELAATKSGEDLFASVGCATCHAPDISGVTGIYSDFLLYSLDSIEGDGSYSTIDTPNIALPIGYPESNEWQTPPLWGVADSAPYFHDGGSSTLEAAILRHDGAARHVTKRFKELTGVEQQQVVQFLKSLRAPAPLQ